MNEEDLKHLALVIMQLHIENGRLQRTNLSQQQELAELKKLSEPPKGEEN